MTLEFHPYVMDDVRVAATGYEAVSPAIADAFIAEVSARLGKVLDDPEGFPFCGPNTSFRRAKLWRFPQSIVYRVEDDIIYVSLIAQALVNEDLNGAEKAPRLNIKVKAPRETRLQV